MNVETNRTGQVETPPGREEALAPLKQVRVLMPNGLLPHWVLTICYAESGREKEAQAEAAEMLRINPQFSVEALPAVSSLQRSSDGRA